MQVVELARVVCHEEGADVAVVNAFADAHRFFAAFIERTPIA